MKMSKRVRDGICYLIKVNKFHERGYKEFYWALHGVNSMIATDPSLTLHDIKVVNRIKRICFKKGWGV